MEEEDDIERLLFEIENDELGPDWSWESIDIAGLPSELQNKLEYFFVWNDYLIPDLRYRIEVTYLELYDANNCTGVPDWFTNLVNRMAWWVICFCNCSAYSLEAECIADELKQHSLWTLEESFTRLVNYNILLSD